MINISTDSVINSLAPFGIYELTQSNKFDNIRLITNINVLEIESPDDRWLLGGELILSTLNMCNTSNDIIEIIQSLNKNNASALAVHAALDKDQLITNDVIEAANQNAIALLVIPKEISYSKIMSTLYDKLLHTRSKYLSKTEQINNEIKKILMKDDIKEELIHKLSQIIKGPVVLFNEFFSIDTFACFDKQDMAFVESLQSQKSYFQDIKKDRNTETETIIKVPVVISDKDYEQLVFCVRTKDTIPYNIVVWQKKKASLFDQEVLISTLNNAAQILGILYIRDLKTSNPDDNGQTENMYQNLIKGCIQDNRTSYLSKIEKSNYHALCKFQMYDSSKCLVYNKSVLSLIKRMSKWLTINSNTEFFSISEDKCILLFLHFNDENKKTCMEQLHQIPHSLRNEILDQEGIEFVKVCVSMLQGELESLNRAYECVNKIQRITSKIQRLDGIFDKKNIDIHYFLDIQDLNTFNEICQAEIDIFHDCFGKSAESLLETLENYYENNCNLINTSEKMYLHVNTVKYRLEKIRNIYGNSLFEDGNMILKYHIILKKRHLLK